MEIAAVLLQHLNAFDVATTTQAVDDTLCVPPAGNIHLTICSALPHVTLDHGMSITPTPLPDDPTQFRLVVIPGFANVAQHISAHSHLPLLQAWDSSEEANATRQWILAAHRAGASVVSLGSAAFFLAWAGLLTNVIATTRPEFCTTLAVSYPEIQVRSDVPFVRDSTHHIWTSAGGTANLSLCLALHAAGQGVLSDRHTAPPSPIESYDAQTTPHRSRRSQHVNARRASITALTTRILHSLSDPWPLRKMAQFVHLSERTLQRYFSEELGMTATEWLKQKRVHAASKLLETTSLTVEQIARRVGMGNGNLLRKHFLTVLGMCPSRYRAEHQSTALDITDRRDAE